MGSIRRKVAEKLMLPNPHVFVKDTDEGLRKTLNEKYGLMTKQAIISNSEEPCSYMKIPFNIDKYEIGFAFPMHSPFTDMINYFISKNIENGNFKRLHRNWQKDIPCQNNPGLDSMGFANVISAFFMIVGGIIITTLIFLVEMYTGKKKKMKMKSYKTRKEKESLSSAPTIPNF